MGIIWFNVKEAYEYLMENGEVCTLRDHYKKDGRAMLKSSLEGKPFYKGMVTIMCIDVIVIDSPTSRDMLRRFVKLSGFKTIEEWLSKLNKEKNGFYLFYVRKI